MPRSGWDLSKPGFNGQKRSKISAIALEAMTAEIWLGGRVVNGAPDRPTTPRLVANFTKLTDFSRCQGPAIGRVSARFEVPLEPHFKKDFA